MEYTNYIEANRSDILFDKVHLLKRKISDLESEIEELYRRLDELDKMIAERDETIYYLKRRNVQLNEWLKRLSVTAS